MQLLGLVTDDTVWANWSIGHLAASSVRGPLFINDIVYAELAVRYRTYFPKLQLIAPKFKACLPKVGTGFGRHALGADQSALGRREARSGDLERLREQGMVVLQMQKIRLTDRLVALFRCRATMRHLDG